MRERYDPWTGRAWIDLPGQRPEPFAVSLRQRLLAEDPYRLWSSDWQHGCWPVLPAGLPEAWAKIIGSLLLVLGAVGAGALHPLAGLGLAAAGSLLLLRRLTRLRTGPDGLALGGSAGLPWTQLRGIEVLPGRRSEVVHLLIRGPSESRWASLPAHLLPDLSAHLAAWDVQLKPYQPSLDRTYEVAAARLRQAPLVALLSSPLLTAALQLPWALWWGLTAGGILAAIGASLRARSLGWSTPAVLNMTLAYGWLLLCLGVAASWLGIT